MTAKILSRSGLNFKTHFFCDSYSKYPLQSIAEYAIGKSREILHSIRCSFGKSLIKVEKSNPVFVSSIKRVPNSSFRLLRPGLLNEVTSKWVRDSLASAVAKNFRRKALQRGSGLCFVGMVLSKKNSLLTDEEEYESLTFLIRDAFSSVPWTEYNSKIINAVSVKDLKIGEMISKGCNAAVYSAKYIDHAQICRQTSEVCEEKDLKNESTNFLSITPNFTESVMSETDMTNVEDHGLKQTLNKKLIMSHSDEAENTSLGLQNNGGMDPGLFNNFKSEDLAVKIMFNYSAESNAYAIWNAMYKETMPLVGEFSLDDIRRSTARKKRLIPHPNIVEMYSAFADQVILLPEALNAYPHALPTRLKYDGCGRNMTLFIVMKRYDCSLKDFLSNQHPSPRTSLLLLTQLLEALVHLYQNGVAHRDLKTDNILLDLSQGNLSPRLVVTDFGCCSESLTLSYTSRDVDKGGNMMLMAPEVVNAEPGPFTVIDYSRSDLWTAGTLAYEIFGSENPFSSTNVRNYSYLESQLPSLPVQAPPAVQRLVNDILHFNPKKRPSQNFSATVCQLLLHAPATSIYENPDSSATKRIPKWISEFSAKTFLQAFATVPAASSTDFQLRHTFCTRMQYLEVAHAFSYIREALSA